MKKQILIPLTLIFLLLILISPTSAIISAASYDARGQDSSKQLGSLSNQFQASPRINQPQNHSLKDKVIVVDPGHGGSDTGAIGPSNIAKKM